MISQFTTYLKNKLNEELPGKKAHQEAAPYRKVTFQKKDIEAATKSGVLILFYPKGQEIFTVLIQRTVYEGKHSGQISFPGGKLEKEDQNITKTALREAKEEIGIIPNQVSIIGHLSDVFIPVSNFHVVPTVGTTEQNPNFIIEEREVETIIELNIKQLVHQGLAQRKVEMGSNLLLKVPTFEHQNKIIWGATALMLNELKYLLKDWEV